VTQGTSYPTPFHILAHLSQLAAILEAGDRAKPNPPASNIAPGTNRVPPGSYYTDRAMDLWDAAKSTLVRRGIDIPQPQPQDVADRRELPQEQLEGQAYQVRHGEPLGGG
jgi:hypothetical protein